MNDLPPDPGTPSVPATYVPMTTDERKAALRPTELQRNSSPAVVMELKAAETSGAYARIGPQVPSAPVLASIIQRDSRWIAERKKAIAWLEYVEDQVRHAGDDAMTLTDVTKPALETAVVQNPDLADDFTNTLAYAEDRSVQGKKNAAKAAKARKAKKATPTTPTGGAKPPTGT